MSEFKSQAEVWKALLDGKIIKITGGRSLYKLIDGNLNHLCEDVWHESIEEFSEFYIYSIYNESKQKKVVRMAPVLRFVDNRYFISDEVFASQDSAICHYKDNSFKFVKWLIDTHGIDVEVDDE